MTPLEIALLEALAEKAAPAAIDLIVAVINRLTAMVNDNADDFLAVAAAIVTGIEASYGNTKSGAEKHELAFTDIADLAVKRGKTLTAAQVNTIIEAALAA